MSCIRLLLPLFTVLMMAAQPNPAAAEACPERPACHGCGCKGGPGYRGPNGQCVGFKTLTHICGTPPTERCTFENAPGTGANAECAMQPHSRRQQLERAALPPAGHDSGDPAEHD